MSPDRRPISFIHSRIWYDGSVLAILCHSKKFVRAIASSASDMSFDVMDISKLPERVISGFRIVLHSGPYTPAICMTLLCTLSFQYSWSCSYHMFQNILIERENIRAFMPYRFFEPLATSESSQSVRFLSITTPCCMSGVADTSCAHPSSFWRSHSTSFVMLAFSIGLILLISLTSRISHHWASARLSRRIFPVVVR